MASALHSRLRCTALILRRVPLSRPFLRNILRYPSAVLLPLSLIHILRRRHFCPGSDNCPRLQPPAFSALRSRHGMAGFLGFYRIQQCIAPRFPGACSVLLQQLWLGLGEFRTGSQYRTRFKGEGMDETSLSLRRPDCHRVYLYLRYGDICVALDTNNRMHALRAFYCQDVYKRQRLHSCFRTITMENSFPLTFRIPLQQMPSTAGHPRRQMERLQRLWIPSMRIR